MKYAYRLWDDPYFWKWYVAGDKVYKFVTKTDGSFNFKRVI